jgi:hypothetical protein
MVKPPSTWFKKVQFTDTFIQQLELTVETADAALLNVPKLGPLLLLQIIPSVALRDYFIFTNPLSTGAKINLSSLRQCQRQLEKFGLLVIVQQAE